MFNQVNEYVDLLEDRVPWNLLVYHHFPASNFQRAQDDTDIRLALLPPETRRRKRKRRAPVQANGILNHGASVIIRIAAPEKQVLRQMKVQISWEFLQCSPAKLAPKICWQWKMVSKKRSFLRNPYTNIQYSKSTCKTWVCLRMGNTKVQHGIAAIREKTLRWNVWKLNDYCNVAPPSYKMVYKPH